MDDKVTQQVAAEMREAKAKAVNEDAGFFMKASGSYPHSYLHCEEVAGESRGPRPECILANKVINECFIAECPIILRTTIPGVQSIEDCQVTYVDLIAKDVPEDDVVELTFRFYIEIDVNTDIRACRVVDFVKRVVLRGADRDAFCQHVQKLLVFRFAQCLGCRVVDDDTVECEIGLFALLKLVTLAQLLVSAEFCPMPPECVQISPITCPEFLERAERGDFLPPVPRQFFP